MDALGPVRGNVTAVVVTYHPAADVTARVRALATQFGRVILVDNHSNEEALASLRQLAHERSEMILLQNSENLGIAAALNQGCRIAVEQGAGWVVTFDQDSVPSADLLDCVSAEWAAHPERDQLGLIGINFRLGIGKTQIREGTGLADARVVITSGSFLNLAAWRAVGPFREDFFIDEVDHEFALRLRRHGWSVKITRRVLMEHASGSQRCRNVLDWQLPSSHHSALRRYYMMRNRVHLAREYVKFDPSFVTRQLLSGLREAAVVTLFETAKFAKFRAMARGVIDGVCGRTGLAAPPAKKSERCEAERANEIRLPAADQRVLVCCAHFHPHVGGVERFTRELWSRLVARGWNVTVLTANTNAAAEREIIDGLCVLRLPAWKLKQGRLPILLPGFKLRRVLRELSEWGPDVVVTNTRFFPTSILGTRFARRRAVPCLHIDHGSAHVRVGSRFGNAIAALIDHTVGAWALRHATRCVGVSRSVAGFLSHLGRHDAGVLHNGVSTKVYANQSHQIGGQYSVGPVDPVVPYPVVLYVGRLFQDKGILDLLDAFERLPKDAGAHLVVAGDGPLMPQLKQRVRARRDVHLLGAVSPTKVARLMAGCDVFVHPSACSEGLPTAILEAGAAGKAIIATPMGGTEEVITSPKHGLLVPPNDPDKLLDAIERLLQNPGLRSQMGGAVQRHVQALFDWDHIADEAEALLRDLVSLRETSHLPDQPKASTVSTAGKS